MNSTQLHSISQSTTGGADLTLDIGGLTVGDDKLLAAVPLRLRKRILGEKRHPGNHSLRLVPYLRLTAVGRHGIVHVHSRLGNSAVRQHSRLKRQRMIWAMSRIFVLYLAHLTFFTSDEDEGHTLVSLVSAKNLHVVHVLLSHVEDIVAAKVPITVSPVESMTGESPE